MYFPQFYGRLVERIDAQQMRGEDCFQHEMHHQRAQRPLVQPVRSMVRTGRPAVERLRHGLRLRRHEVARGLAGEVAGPRCLGEFGATMRVLPPLSARARR